jgi:hypothetical protein
MYVGQRYETVGFNPTEILYSQATTLFHLKSSIGQITGQIIGQTYSMQLGSSSSIIVSEGNDHSKDLTQQHRKSLNVRNIKAVSRRFIMNNTSYHIGGACSIQYFETQYLQHHGA